MATGVRGSPVLSQCFDFLVPDKLLHVGGGWQGGLFARGDEVSVVVVDSEDLSALGVGKHVHAGLLREDDGEDS